MKILDFKNLETSLEDVIKDVKKTGYLPIKSKNALINNIVTGLIVVDEHGMINYSEIKKDVLFVNSVLAFYTDIELLADPFDNYDIAIESGLYKELNNEDVKVLKLYLDCALEKEMQKNSPSYILAKTSSNAITILDNTMEHIDGMLDKGDPNIIAKYLSKAIDKIADKLPDFSKVDIAKKIKGLN